MMLTENKFLGVGKNCLQQNCIFSFRQKNNWCEMSVQEDFTWQEIWRTSIHLFQGSFAWPFSELFSANVSLWNQYKYTAFNILLYRILIVSYKMLIITGISNEKTNEITIYWILCQNVTTFYRQELASLFQV